MNLCRFKYGLGLMIITTSCVVYHPQMTDIPLIKEKGEIRINAGICLLPAIYSTISYGLTDKIALQAFCNYGSGDRYYYHGALGLYKDFSNKKIVELYGGVGNGYANAFHSSTGGHLKGNYQLYFTQLNFGKVENSFANMDYGLGIKLGYMHSNFTDVNYYESHQADMQFDNYIYESMLIEPIFFIRFGKKKLQYHLNIGYSWINKFTHLDKNIPYGIINTGVGINYIF